MKTIMISKWLIFTLVFCYLFIIQSCKQVEKPEEEHVRNVVLMIGDGMGVGQIYAGMIANGGHLNLENCQYVGFQKTHSANSFITDSGAGGTALATGVKTRNGSIGVDTSGRSVKSVLEYAEDHGLSTGLIATSSITHATPASFIAHNPDRNNYEAIAADFLKTSIEIFIGGGRDHFEKREDGLNISDSLRNRGYEVFYALENLKGFTGEKVAVFTADVHNPPVGLSEKAVLPDAASMAISLLDKNPKGFFLMVEGSQIDWGGHRNHTEYVTTELIDFDNALGIILDYAKKDGNTLVIVTADHETGGMAIHDGNPEAGMVEAAFTSEDHTGVMVPVFAYGPGAEKFTGIYENTDIFSKMMESFGFQNK